MFDRDFELTALNYSNFPAIAILGPRQAGKTTLAKKVFNQHVYTTFEDPDVRAFASEDPRQFLRTHENASGIIIDEFQYVPSLLSYLQLEIDNKKRPGYFVLTGSQNFLMNQAITQSLAGRIAILTLHPLSLHEIKQNNLMDSSAKELIFKGSYPRLYAEKIEPQKLYPSYIQSYVERDVRQLLNVGDLNSFQRFLKLCAGRVGQLLNLSELAAVCGVSVTTAKRWISILEASYIIFLLQPHFSNFNKRLTKSPKLYFYDTGLCCSLLGIDSSKVLALSPFFGSLFENFIISDINKQFYNLGRVPSTYFWRDLNGRIVIDCLIEDAQKLIPIEIKSGETLVADFFIPLKKWSELTNSPLGAGYLFYGGDLVEKRPSAQVMGWPATSDFVDKLIGGAI